jgi:hypothetical protein
LTDYATLKKWECLASALGEALAAAVRKHHLPDFSNWQPPPPLPAPSLCLRFVGQALHAVHPRARPNWMFGRICHWGHRHL